MTHKMLTGENVRQVLIRGAYEARRAFDSRKKRADWKPYTRDIISRLTGELFSRAGEISRQQPVSEDFLAEVGPDNESYHVQLINLAETLTAYHEAWVIHDPGQGMMVVEPQFVPRWTDQAVVLKGQRNTGGDVFQNQKAVDAWTVYYDNGYETYVEDNETDGVAERMVDSGVYREGFSFASGPPAVRITLPWKVRFGLSVARAHRALYRMESKFDDALTNSLGGLIQIATGGDDTLKQDIEKALKKGAVAIPYDADSGEHKPLNVGTKGLQAGQNALDRKRKELYRSAYQTLDQASSRMTATEANARSRSGPAAALSVLAETMQSAEEEILPVIAQAEDLRNASRTISVDVSWPTDYTHAFDRSDEELVRAVFGTLKMPVDDETAAEIILSYLQGEGIDADREAVLEEVRQRRDQDAQATQSYIG